jgi:hydrogenase maturation factor
MTDPCSEGTAGHCITCADEAIPMRVVEWRGGTAVCQDQRGERHEVAVELVEPVVADQQVLVHAGVAIA